MCGTSARVPGGRERPGLGRGYCACRRTGPDVWFARAHRLSRDDLRYILDPHDVHGPDFPSETFRVLKEKEQKHFGEYRTRRLVLEAWDGLAGG